MASVDPISFRFCTECENQLRVAMRAPLRRSADSILAGGDPGAQKHLHDAVRSLLPELKRIAELAMADVLAETKQLLSKPAGRA